MITNEIIAGSEIYMSQHKERFMCSLSDNDNALRNFTLLFRQIRKYEECFAKDILFFTRNQIIAMFEDLDATPSTFEQRCGFFNKYFEANGQVFPKFSFYELDNRGAIRHNSIRDLNEFLYIINNAFQPDSMQTLDVMRKSCVILLYLGATKSELTSIRKEDFDENNTSLRLNRFGTKYQNIRGEFVEVLKLCKQMTTYNSLNPKYANYSMKYLQDSDYLIRCDSSRGNNIPCPSFFIDKIFNSDTFDSVNKSLTPTRVIEAGLYHTLYNMENEQGLIDPKYFQAKLVEYFNKPMTKYQHYLQNYTSWKKAFDL